MCVLISLLVYVMCTALALNVSQRQICVAVHIPLAIMETKLFGETKVEHEQLSTVYYNGQRNVLILIRVRCP